MAQSSFVRTCFEFMFVGEAIVAAFYTWASLCYEIVVKHYLVWVDRERGSKLLPFVLFRSDHLDCLAIHRGLLISELDRAQILDLTTVTNT